MAIPGEQVIGRAILCPRAVQDTNGCAALLHDHIRFAHSRASRTRVSEQCREVNGLLVLFNELLEKRTR